MDRYKGHSPAPWSPTDNDLANASIVDADGNLVVAGEWDGWMVPFYCGGERAEANARLILDAPEILVERDRLREALTPSTETKSAYMSEFSFEAVPGLTVFVPWTTIKEIMAAVRSHAGLQEAER